MASHLPHRTPIYRSVDIRRIEALAAALPDAPPLMERAGLAAAEVARNVVGDDSCPVLVIAGPGNNGGDAVVVARYLKQWWFNVTVVFAGDEARLSGDAALALRAWRETGGELHDRIPERKRWSLVVDGLFGIGLQRDVTGAYATLIQAMNDCGAPVLALDVPSGLDSDTGRVLGHAVRALHTVTFIALKPGLLTLDGPDHCGNLHIASLGLDAAALAPAPGTTIGEDVLRGLLPRRPLNSHKGNFGSVAILGGAPGMTGAALLAGRAALKLGSGRVYVGILDEDGPRVDHQQPELMLRPASHLAQLDNVDCIAAGPGLSQSLAALTRLITATKQPVPLVLDADALNLLATDSALQQALSERTAATILTPHPAEAARLLTCRTAEVQADRIAAGLQLARRYRAGVVLKGAGSVCAWPEGDWTINTSGNPGMASAGMGDVLTGMVAALLAQGVPARAALVAAVYLHGAAADTAVAEGAGPVGLTAGEVIDGARALLNAHLQ